MALLIALGAVALASFAKAAKPAGRLSADGDQQVHRVHLPDARAESRQLDLARQLLEEQRFSEAVPLLVDLLQRSEDRAYGVRSGGRGGFFSLKQLARQTLDGLSPAGRRAYELATSSAAQRELQDAIASGDQQALASVARRYPATIQAATACWRSAEIAADAGENERALAWLGELRSNVRFAAEFEPQTSLLASACYAALGDEQEAFAAVAAVAGDRLAAGDKAGLLKAFGDNAPSASAFNEPQALAAALVSAVRGAGADHDAWLGVGGDRRGSRPVSGGEPHLWARWNSRAVATADEGQRSAAQAVARRRLRLAAAALASPVCVGDQVIARTPDRVIGLDWQSGRRLWETRPVQREPAGQETPGELIGRRTAPDLLGNRGWPGGWRDAVAASLSTDGRLVFAVHNQDLLLSGRLAEAIGQRQPVGARFRGTQRAPATPRNRLAAYDPRLEGKLVWELGGGRSGADEKARFFLAAPLAIDGRLLVPVEHDQTLHLWELDPDTGARLWSQPLVSMESGVGESLDRRLAGASLAVDGEVVVCSTGAGVVVAVDLTRRTLKWACRLPVQAGRRPRTGGLWGRQNDRFWSQAREQRWLENRVAIAAERVVVATPESDHLHAIDLASGERQWSVERDEAVLISSVAPGGIAVLTPTGVRLVDPVSGATAWRTKVPEGRAVVGRGLRVDETLLVPLTGGGLMLADLEQKTTRSARAGEGAFGNLVYHRNAVVSQDRDSIDRFDLLGLAGRGGTGVPKGAVQETGGAGLSLLHAGERYLGAGDWRAAIVAFERLEKTEEHRLVARDRLWRARRVALRSEEPTAEGLRALLDAAPTDQDRLEVLSIGARAAADRGDLQRVREYASLATTLDGVPDRLTSAADGYWVADARRLSGAVADAWSGLAEDEQSGWTRSLGEAVEEEISPTRLAHCGLLYDALPIADQWHATLAGRWRERGDFLLAARHRSLAALPDYAAGGTTAPPAFDWSTRQADSVTEQRRAAANPPQRTRPRARRRSTGFVCLPVERPGATGPHQISYGLTTAANGQALIGWDKNGWSRFRVPLPTVAGELARRLQAPNGNRIESPPYAWRVADQVVLAVGGDVLGVNTGDAQRGEEPRVWRAKSVMQAFADERREPGPPSAALPLRASHGGVRPTIADRWAALGVSAHGVLIRAPGAVACLNVATGRPQWVRTDLELDRARVVVGKRYAYARRRDGSMLRVRLLDGREDSGWRGPDGRWVHVRNGHLLSQSRSGNELSVSITDTRSGEALFEEAFADGRMMRVANSDELLIVCFPEQRDQEVAELVVIDSALGAATLRARVESPVGKRSVAAWRRPFGLLVALGRPSPRGIGSLGALGALKMESGPLLEGPLLCLADDGAVRWRAEVSGFGVLNRTPVACPLVVLGRRDQGKTAAGGMLSSRLLVLDGATGRSVAEPPRVPEDVVRDFRLRYRGGATPRLEALFARHKTHVRLTDAPLAPGPAYTAAVESPAKPSLSQLWGALQNAAKQPPKKEEDDDP